MQHVLLKLKFEGLCCPNRNLHQCMLGRKVEWNKSENKNETLGRVLTEPQFRITICIKSIIG